MIDKQHFEVFSKFCTQVSLYQLAAMIAHSGEQEAYDTLMEQPGTENYPDEVKQNIRASIRYLANNMDKTLNN